MQRPNEFFCLTRTKLKKRLDDYLAENTPRKTNIRSFFYECRNEYIIATGDTTLDSKAENVYITWQITMLKWFKDHKAIIEGNKWWWILRDALNIEASGKAICMVEGKNYLVTRESRKQITKDISLVLVCEKSLISEFVFDALAEEGYKLHVISAGGNLGGDVQDPMVEVALEMAKLSESNFYILFLHDYDLAGVQMMATLKGLHEGAIDIGVNEALLEYMEATVPDYDRSRLDEAVINKKGMGEVREYMRTSPDYTLAGFEYLLGTKFHAKKKNGELKYKRNGEPKYWWRGSRIELDAINGPYGIEPIVGYILQTIERQCLLWDLSRIGVGEFELEEPENRINKALNKTDSEVAGKYGDVEVELLKPKNEIIELLEKELTAGSEFAELVKKHWLLWDSTYHPVLVETVRLREEYTESIELEFVPDFEEELEAINDQIENYHGDVREGKADLELETGILQETVNEVAQNLPDWNEFYISWNSIDVGEDELENITANSKADMIRQAIKILKKELRAIAKGAKSKQ